jgi:ABC-type transport system substrate-binding protein
MHRSPHPSRVRRLVSLTLVLGIVAVGCGGDDQEGTSPTSAVSEERLTESGDPTPGGKLLFGLQADSDGYNPAVSRFSESGHFVASAIYDPLATWNEEGEAVPFFAESIEPVNPEATEWQIKIPTGRTYHNGDLVTAASVSTALNYMMTGLVTASSLNDVNTIEPIDDTTVRVTTDRPWAQFPALLTTQVGYVMNPSMLTDPDSAANPVGTGPFKKEEWVEGEHITLVKNDQYWRKDEAGTQLPYLDGLEFRFVTDEAERLRQLEVGDLDMMQTLSPQEMNELEADESLQYLAYLNGPEDVVTLDTAKAPFDNKHARMALALATDQPRFVDEVQLNSYELATSPFAPGQLGYREDNGYPAYDLEAAKQEVELYKQETGQDALRFTYLGGGSSSDLAAQQWLVDEWAKAGIEATIEQVQQNVLITDVVTRQDIYQASDWRNWAQPNPDPDFVWWHSSSVKPQTEGISLNVAHFVDPEIDQALETARASTDDTERDEAYATVARRLGEEVPYLFLGRIVWALGAQDNVHGFEAGKNGTLGTIGSKSWIGELWIQS